ncbi:Pirin [hydrothermal vent metagenome]|uniref:Pirin n=1 Tax=hydrothermal vent metagenome TaxID=652676 RepID=A0A3B0W386_9ZZZZ
MDKYKKIAAKELYYLEASDMHPANTYFHFSFAEYYDPKNMNFGVLRVVNDDNVRPGSGFGTHPHENMEIFSYVVSGKLTHRDSAGNHEVLGRGEVQCISAGAGVTHSELNEQDDWCRFLQIWVMPESRGLPVRYDLHKFSLEDRKNRLLHIVSGSKNKGEAPLYLCQDVNAYVSELTEQGVKLSFALGQGRQAYLYCFEGAVDIDRDIILGERDALKIYGKNDIEIASASGRAHFIIIEMPLEKPL